MTLFLGQSNSGKSVLIADCLYKLREDIPNIVVICPTDSQNRTYCQFVPPECIIDENISSEKLLIKLNDIYQRQMRVTQIYNTANDQQFLENLIDKLELQTDDRVDQIRDIIQELEQKQLDIQENPDNVDNYQEIMAQLLIDISNGNQKLVNKYKKLITQAVKEDCSILNVLDKKEREVANALNINPKLVLVLDDIAASLDLQIQKSEIVKKIFFQGRHSNLTCFIAVQNDKKLLPELRQQAHYVFFTDCVCFEGFQKSGGFSTKQLKEHSDAMRIYKDQHVKVLFDRCSVEFYYVKAYQRFQFQFGSPALISFCKFVKPKKQTVITPFNK